MATCRTASCRSSIARSCLNGPKEPTEANLLYPQISRMDLPPNVGAHTVFPLLGMPIAGVREGERQTVRDMLAIVDEATGQRVLRRAREPMMWIADITDRDEAVRRRELDGARGERQLLRPRRRRFGTHSTQENFTPIYYKRVLFVAYFNAGVRAVDIRDPFNPKEIGYYIPRHRQTDNGCVGRDRQASRCKTAIQTNNVEVDDRGYVYVVDRANTGLHILELTGAARKVANFQ